jgi:hypothetical protein
MKKEITSDELELYTGGFGVAVTNGSISGGQIEAIKETDEHIKVFFKFFGTKIGEEIRLRQSYEMEFAKPITLERHDGCIVLEENGNSHLLLYPNSMRVLEKYKRKVVAK